jgi:hypothetical protein
MPSALTTPATRTSAITEVRPVADQHSQSQGGYSIQTV